MAMSAFAVSRFFTRLRDPRRRHRKLHNLIDIISIAICAVIAGANDWQLVVTFAQHREAWLVPFSFFLMASPPTILSSVSLTAFI